MFNFPKFYMLCGLPASGKSHYALDLQRIMSNETNEKAVIVSSDNIRKELYGDENIQGNPEEVFNLVHERILQSLNNGVNVIYDATNLKRKYRLEILNKFPKFIKTECHIVWKPIYQCIKDDSNRERSVGEKVINKMVQGFEMPFYDEGFDIIKYVSQEVEAIDGLIYISRITKSMNISHDNPHHTFNVYEHSQRALKYARDKNFNEEVKLASLWHDCGKPYVKSFINTKGETTDIAHYYNHENVGAYISLGITECIKVAWLINHHMDKFHHSKYYDRLPQFLKEELDKLNECDINAL